MKHNFLKIGLLATMVATAVNLTSCKEENNGEFDDENAASVVAQYVDHTVIPTYTNLATTTELLVEQLKTLKAEPTDAHVQAACETFLEARAWWEKSEAFLFGAAGDFGIDPHIDSWPLDVNAFNTLMNSPAMIASLDGEDGDEVAGNNLGNALLGFHGIEYILFANGQPKPAASLSENDLIYVVAVAGDLRNRCFQLEVSWAGDEAPESHVEKLDQLELPYTVASGNLSYGENMKKAGNSGSTYSSRIVALMAIVDGCKSIADEVGTSKIGAPYTGEDVNYIESPYSQKSIVDFYDNIISIQNSYMGGVEGQRNEGKSLHKFVKDNDADLDARVIAAIENALEKINAMPAPFVNNYTNAACGEAMEACAAVDAVFSEVNDLLRKL